MELRERDCPVCGPDAAGREFYPARVDESRLNEFAFSSRKVPEFMHYRYLQCRQCDVLYSSPAPAPEKLAPAYEQAAYDSDVEATFAARTYGRYLAKRILPSLHDRRGALDIGTGNGAFLRDLLDLGFTDVQGVEPSRAPIAAAPPEIRALIKRGMFRVSDFAPGSFSLISCFQTIEHVYEPLKIARDMFQLLRPGGVAYFVTHNYQALQAKLLRERSPIFDVEHFQLFSPDSLQRLLRAAGFERAEAFPIVNRYPSQYWLRLLPLGAKTKAMFGAGLRKLHLDALAIPLPAGNLAAYGIKR